MELPQKNRMVVIVGATASGKSRLALSLATEFGGEIISADSRQVYRYMDIGTAKPSHKDLKTIPHHLIDIIDPDMVFGLARFINMANQATLNVKLRGKLSILAGGTGQYIWGMLEGWQVPNVPPDDKLRESLYTLAQESSADDVHKILESVNKKAAQRIDKRNLRRVIRAIEVSKHRVGDNAPQKSNPGFTTLIIGLKTDRAKLYKRIDDRVDQMIDAGWVDEVHNLRALGYERGLTSMSGVGYSELASHIEGEICLNQAISKIKTRTHKYARQQHAWFKDQDSRIAWVDSDLPTDGAATILQEWLLGKS